MRDRSVAMIRFQQLTETRVRMEFTFTFIHLADAFIQSHLQLRIYYRFNIL